MNSLINSLIKTLFVFYRFMHLSNGMPIFVTLYTKCMGTIVARLKGMYFNTRYIHIFIISIKI